MLWYYDVKFIPLYVLVTTYLGIIDIIWICVIPGTVLWKIKGDFSDFEGMLNMIISNKCMFYPNYKIPSSAEWPQLVITMVSQVSQLF